MSSERGKVFFFSGDTGPLYCTDVRVNGDVTTARVVNGGWYMHLQGDSLKACRGSYEMPTHFEWESNYTPEWDDPIYIKTGVELLRSVDVPARVSSKFYGNYADVIDWAEARTGDAAVDALSDIQQENLDKWGSSPVVAVGYNRTDAGHYMTPSMRVETNWNSEDQRIELSSGAKTYSLDEYLGRLVEHQQRLCRVWLMTEDGSKHCCYWYEQDKVDRKMVDHFESVMIARDAGANLGGFSATPSKGAGLSI